MDDRVATALCVLGPLEVVRDGECVRLGSGQQRRLLAVLLVHANEVVSSDRFVDVLWGDGAPPSAIPTLRTLVSRLRATLGADRLETRPPGYRLRVARGEVDALRFEELVREGLGSQHAEFALGMFDEALDLWRGSPYQEFASEEFAATEVARLVELRARAIEERSAALLELGRPEEVIGELEAEIAVEPFRERLRALLMLALARSGRPVESLRAYDEFRRLRSDEVGVVPSPGLQELNDDIVRQHPDVSWAGSPTKDANAGDLPSGTLSFLFTEVEGSTRLWEEHPDLMHDAMPRHKELLRDVVASHGGFVVTTTGDGFHAVFESAHDAVTAAVDAQSALVGGEWNVTETVRVRMGIHTGEAESRDGDYSGSAVNRAARLMSVAHGGQIVVSTATAELLRDAIPEKYGFVDLGEHRLHDLARRERIFQVVHPELPAVFPPLRSLDMFPSKLPSQLTAFVGRERELTEVARALGAARVVTLTGIGGVGKTRLALEAAARVLAQYRDGAWFCELAPVGDPGAVLEAVATTLGVVAREGHTVEDGVLEFLRVKQLLLVLDNCEHLLASVTDLVDRVARACPRVTVLATSRESLALKGERILALGSLVVPDLDASTDEAAGADAVRLFVERAADARAGFVLHDDNAAAIVQICRYLDGIPLAIELAAARVQAMTPEEIATRLDDQIGLLRGGTRGAVARHQTLRRAMDWSYDLLSDDERLVLQRLSVFAGGATLNDAVAVVGGDSAEEFDVLEQLGGLVRRSLVLADDEEGHTRYRLVETVRQYAHERLVQAGTAGTTHRRHAVHYAALAEEAGRGLRGADQLAWLARLAPEMDNLRAAQAWAIDQHEIDLALDVIVSLCVIGTTVEHAAIQWARALATDTGVDTRPLGPTLLALAAFDAAVGWPDRARATAFEARRIAAEAALGRPPNPANLRAPTTLAQHFGTPADAVDCARRWVEAARAAGDRYETVEALTIFAATMVETDLNAAVAVMEECVAEARELACPSSLSIALIPFGVHLLHTDPKQSVAILEEAVRVGTTVGFRFAVGAAYSTLAWAYHALGDQRAGLQARRQALDLQLAVGGGENLVGSFVAVAVLLTAFDDDEAAAVLQGAASAVPDLAGGSDEARALIPVLRERLGEDRLRELLARGSAMPDDESVAYAHAKLDVMEASLSADD